MAQWRISKAEARAIMEQIVPRYDAVLRSIELQLTPEIDRQIPRAQRAAAMKRALVAFDTVFRDLATYALKKFVCSQCGAESDDAMAQCSQCHAAMENTSQPTIGMGVSTPLESETSVDPAALQHELDNTKRGVKPHATSGFDMNHERAAKKIAKAQNARLNITHNRER